MAGFEYGRVSKRRTSGSTSIAPDPLNDASCVTGVSSLGSNDSTSKSLRGIVHGARINAASAIMNASSMARLTVVAEILAVWAKERRHGYSRDSPAKQCRPAWAIGTPVIG